MTRAISSDRWKWRFFGCKSIGETFSYEFRLHSVPPSDSMVSLPPSDSTECAEKTPSPTYFFYFLISK
uniref:AlNc14C130G6938 protein n=1 Tax=Albugo laibachii Nc14 TaxID=890382 RepID=F0WK86_9STRA|nr:AlNc14C130G6938 [Albugo laibachii Nc14]|eukprot:CCA21689.1 AlNc14C130G6938 [Albugo laibachii Nc14]